MLLARPRAALAWSGHPSRRFWATPLLLVAIALLIALPLDGIISRAAISARTSLGGDLRRELEALQQYGQFTFTVLGMLIILRLDPAGGKLIGRWVIGVILAAAIYQPMKMLVGRPRPKFDDPFTFLGPLGQYPLGPEIGVRHAWEFWAGISSDLWSMPSSHTAAAAVMTVVLARGYPAIRGIVVLLLVIVASMRVMTGAHYASDVLVGAAVGFFAAELALMPVYRAQASHDVATGQTT